MPTKVVLADDHKMFRTGLASIISTFNDVEVIAEATNGAEALRCVEELKPDVLLLDINMPLLTGFEVLEHIRRKNISVKTIMISMHEDDAYVIEALTAGANGYLCKTAEADEIRLAINNVLKNNVHYNEHTNRAMLQQVIGQGKKPVVGGTFDDNFTEKELIILQHLADGFSNSEIAEKIYASVRTVENTRYGMMKKIGVNNGMSLLVYAIKKHLVKV